MNRTAYYNSLKELARAKRSEYNLTTPRVQRSHLRAIYRDEGIRIDLWPHRLRDVRGAYFNDELGPTVMLAKGLPEDPMVFTMAHELKHHLVDRELPVACCSDRNIDEHIEIGAEVFAAEFIFPEQDFAVALAGQGVVAGKCSPEDLVRLKHESRTTLSYAGLAKRAVFLGLALPAALSNVRWKKLEEQLFGVPLYKQLQRRRRH
ncbi:MAG: ImmA/IrrE family metallo-endopeptidase [Phycisphaerales bacterium]